MAGERGQSPEQGEAASSSAQSAAASQAGAEGPALEAGAPHAGGEASRLFFSSRPLAGEVHDRLAIFAVRALFFFIAAGLGLYGVQVLGDVTLRADLNPALGIAVACVTALILIGLEAAFSRGPVRTISAITFGLIIGLVLSLVFQPVVEFIVLAVTSAEVRLAPRFGSFLSFLRILTTTIFCYFGVTILLQTKDDFKFIIPYVEFRRDIKGHTPLILDTSCFVDGRIQALLSTKVFDQRLLVPKFVLTEMQTIADSADRSLRERGRRGMDMLHEIERRHHLEFVEHPLGPSRQVDGALIELAALLGGKIVTTDFNLQKNARLQGVAVLNINDLATALKPAFVPGEAVTVRLLREGDDKGQAVGFLKDGTMVVVENARNRIGQEVGVEVTSSLQTSAGKMVFGKLRRPVASTSKAGNDS